MFGVSIIIATYNRASLLAETLANLTESSGDLITSSVGGEVIIVNNNSNDDTAKIGQDFANRFPFVKCVFEEKQGLSHARNAGIAAAKNDILVFLDDDVEVADDWLEQLIKPLSDNTIGVVGGKVLPYGVPMPTWLPREYAYVVSVFDPSDTPCDVRTVMGANFVLRRSAIKDMSLFDPKLGRRGTQLLGGEEVELFNRIKSAGYRIFYTPAAVVFHKIQNKVNREYIVNYAYWLGVSEANVDKDVVSFSRFGFKFVRSLFFGWSLYPLLYLVAPSPVGKMRYLIKTQFALGYLTFWRTRA